MSEARYHYDRAMEARDTSKIKNPGGPRHAEAAALFTDALKILVEIDAPRDTLAMWCLARLSMDLLYVAYEAPDSVRMTSDAFYYLYLSVGLAADLERFEEAERFASYLGHVARWRARYHRSPPSPLVAEAEAWVLRAKVPLLAHFGSAHGLILLLCLLLGVTVYLLYPGSGGARFSGESPPGRGGTSPGHSHRPVSRW